VTTAAPGPDATVEERRFSAALTIFEDAALAAEASPKWQKIFEIPDSPFPRTPRIDRNTHRI
jgi:hypothetical protein